jgi:UDP-N-acetylglucosamine 2-epimerase
MQSSTAVGSADGGIYRFLLYVEQNYSFAILRPLQAAAIAAGHQVQWLLVGDDVSASFLAPNETRCASVKAAVDYQPHAVFVPGDRVPSFIPGLKVEVFHGLNESKRGNEYPERGMFDLFCTEGHGRTKMLQPLAEERGYFQVKETGWIKLDNLFNFKQSQSFPRPQILFASTFTPSLSCAASVYDEIKALSQDKRWHWLVTLHPKIDPQTAEKYRQLESENLTFFDNDKVIELLHRADVMVCDNSSIFQEFLLLNKPVVTVNNREPQACFINITTPDALADAIEQALAPSDELLSAIKQYGPNITPYLDGQSSQRVLAAVTEMLAADWQNTKPANLFRNLKMRKKMHYWKW